jgi:putative heme iron utilization protein
MVNDEVQQLLRHSYQGVLSTQSVHLQGYPFGSVVPFCLDNQGRIVILISELAQHTKNIKQDSRCSVLVFAEGDDIQVAARLTIVGDAYPVVDADIADVAARYYRHFPQSQSFHQIHDFSFWYIVPIKYRYIGGFGKIHWAEPALVANPFDGQVEADMIQHMNQDHADTFVLYCQQANIVVPEQSVMTMVGIDGTGFYLKIAAKVVYVAFTHRVNTPQQVREVLVAMVKSARKPKVVE